MDVLGGTGRRLEFFDVETRTPRGLQNDRFAPGDQFDGLGDLTHRVGRYHHGTVLIRVDDVVVRYCHAVHVHWQLEVHHVNVRVAGAHTAREHLKARRAVR